MEKAEKKARNLKEGEVKDNKEKKNDVMGEESVLPQVAAGSGLSSTQRQEGLDVQMRAAEREG